MSRLNTYLSMLNADKDYIQPTAEVSGELSVFKDGCHIADHPFNCAYSEFKSLATCFYKACERKGLSASFNSVRIA